MWRRTPSSRAGRACLPARGSSSCAPTPQMVCERTPSRSGRCCLRLPSACLRRLSARRGSGSTANRPRCSCSLVGVARAAFLRAPNAQDVPPQAAARVMAEGSMRRVRARGSGALLLRESSGEGACAGLAGKVFFTSYGAVERYDLKAGEDLVVDTGHIVAFEDTLSYSIARLGGGLTSFFMGGEGFVCRFRVRFSRALLPALHAPARAGCTPCCVASLRAPCQHSEVCRVTGTGVRGLWVEACGCRPAFPASPATTEAHLTEGLPPCGLGEAIAGAGVSVAVLFSRARTGSAHTARRGEDSP